MPARAELTIVLAKPQTFMNRSGTAVRDLLGSLDLAAPSSRLIVYDDMDLPFGRLRLRERGSPGTHNGMRSVIPVLQTDDVPRLRVGIGQSSPGAQLRTSWANSIRMSGRHGGLVNRAS